MGFCIAIHRGLYHDLAHVHAMRVAQTVASVVERGVSCKGDRYLTATGPGVPSRPVVEPDDQLRQGCPPNFGPIQSMPGSCVAWEYMAHQASVLQAWNLTSLAADLELGDNSSSHWMNRLFQHSHWTRKASAGPKTFGPPVVGRLAFSAAAFRFYCPCAFIWLSPSSRVLGFERLEFFSILVLYRIINLCMVESLQRLVITLCLSHVVAKVSIITPSQTLFFVPPWLHLSVRDRRG